jgi:glycosyltransferase involved in cell wall biosynthesis
LLVHRDAPNRWQRTDGGFAYSVPGLEWQHFPVGKLFTLNLSDYRQFDVAFWDDGKYKGHSEFLPPPPRRNSPFVISYALYPTLSQGHFRERMHRARLNADGVLVDHDDLERWREATGLPVARCAYSVDETVYVPKEKDIDVGFYCVWAWNKERPALDVWLQGYCTRKGWTYASTGGEDRGQDAYADMLGRTKVVIHMNRTPRTRAPRLFDAAACGCAILANPAPTVSGEDWGADRDRYCIFSVPRSEEYRAFKLEDVPEYGDEDCRQVADQLDWLLDQGNWSGVAERARAYVLQYHTWRTRARELRQTLGDMFPALGRRGR